MAPVDESCDAERALHAALLDAPRRPVLPAELDALADPDAADNYRVVLALRERLVAAGTVEACYRRLFGHGAVALPPLFIDQMAHVILRNILDGVTDPIRLRAAELLFRAQKVSIQDESVLLADASSVLAAGSSTLSSIACRRATARWRTRSMARLRTCSASQCFTLLRAGS